MELFDYATEIVRKYYEKGIMKNKKDVIAFFRSYNLEEHISFPKRCFVPSGSKYDKLILIGHSKDGFYPEI